MALAGLTRESIRDISGNLVPFGVLLFFGAWFVVDTPWGWGILPGLAVFGLVGSFAALLFFVTYVVARRIQVIEGDQREGEREAKGTATDAGQR